MAAEGAVRASTEQGYAVRRIEGATSPLPPRSDEELATMREQHPDQAWFWMRAFYDSERQAEAEERVAQPPMTPAMPTHRCGCPGSE